MRLLCRLGRHTRSDSQSAFHRGMFFNRCGACGVDLIRASGEEHWIEPPRGTRVVWRTEGDVPASAVPLASSRRRPRDESLAAYLGVTGRAD